MRRTTGPTAAFLAAFLELACTCPPRVAAPPSPAVPAPTFAVEVLAQPETATVVFNGRLIGETPTSLMVPGLSDLTAIVARHGDSPVIERRIKILSPDRARILFRFGTEPSAVAKRLGLTRVLVFDYSEAVSFDSGKSELKPLGLPILEKQAEILRTSFPGVDVHVCGHTDSTGGDELNLRLSLERARTVEQVLAGNGVAREHLRVQGFGKDYPVESNASPEGRAGNRRTELVLPQ